jgi:D-alanyl-D-alanine carboxypeptidase
MLAKRNRQPAAIAPVVQTMTANVRKPSALPSGNGWAVQVGAYPSTSPAENAALRAKAKIPDLLGGTRLSLPQTSRGGSMFYRARLVGLTENQARTACRRLANHAIPCLAVGEDGAFKTSLF